jgi:hypothetical protein
MATWDTATTLPMVATALAVFGMGFGATVTPRSTAATEALGRAAFGAAAASVTVARMVGMAIGLAVLTAYGSTTIERLTARIFATPEAYQEVLPPELVGRPFNDGLVIEALEAWAAGEAARVLGVIFLVAAVVTLAALPAALALGRRPRMLAARDGRAVEVPSTDQDEADRGGDDRGPGRGSDRAPDGDRESAPTLAL